MATEQERETLARRGMEAYTAGDMETILSVLSEDVEVYGSPELANAGIHRGHDGFTSWLGSWTEAWEEISAEVTETIPVGDHHVVAAVHQVGKGRAGIEVSMDLAFLFEVRDGLCSYPAMLPDTDSAVGLARERESG